MQLGFVSAILGDLTLEEVLAFTADEGFDCVELMCWPPGGSNRRYAGVSHLDVTNLDPGQVEHVKHLVKIHQVNISGLGYYPNPLDGNAEHREYVVDHLKKVIRAAPKLGVRVVNTFIGRDHTRSVEDNWSTLKEVWPGIIREAEQAGVTLGLENCPMIFSRDEWPGGKNLMTTPALWRRIFQEFPGSHLGLNFDPSHLIWQFIDIERCIREFGSRIVHFHAKDTRIDYENLYEVGIMGLGWHTAKIPGLGDVDWGMLFSALTDAGFTGPVCIEVEDRAFEASLESRKRALRQSKRFLEQFVG
jgi:sugar phosphate isomerase/epimerase